MVTSRLRLSSQRSGPLTYVNQASSASSSADTSPKEDPVSAIDEQWALTESALRIVSKEQQTRYSTVLSKHSDEVRKFKNSVLHPPENRAENLFNLPRKSFSKQHPFATTSGRTLNKNRSAPALPKARAPVERK